MRSCLLIHGCFWNRRTLCRSILARDKNRTPKFSVSCQHYSFCGQCVCGFGETVRCQPVQFFILRETQTGEIIDDGAQGKSEVGILSLSAHNEEVLTKLMKKNGLVFEELFVAEPHVFICREHPLANKKEITLDDLQPYPYLVYEQGERNSFYFAEEFLSMLDFFRKYSGARPCNAV